MRAIALIRTAGIPSVTARRQPAKSGDDGDTQRHQIADRSGEDRRRLAWPSMCLTNWQPLAHVAPALSGRARRTDALIGNSWNAQCVRAPADDAAQAPDRASAIRTSRGDACRGSHSVCVASKALSAECRLRPIAWALPSKARSLKIPARPRLLRSAASCLGPSVGLERKVRGSDVLRDDACRAARRELGEVSQFGGDIARLFLPRAKALSCASAPRCSRCGQTARVCHANRFFRRSLALTPPPPVVRRSCI